MNKVFRALVEIPTGFVKACMNNLVHRSNIALLIAVAPRAEITIDKHAKVIIGSSFRARSGSHIRVREKAVLKIGKNVSVNHGCMIVCHDKIMIGNDVQLSPNVMIYDHDHDYRAEGGVKSMKYLTSPITIGSNVWIGANSVILRGASIGDDCVIAAGTIVKGIIPDGSLCYDKREQTVIRSMRVDS